MKLFNGTLRPGKVLEVIEDGKGVIKVSAPGLFSEEDIDFLPPVEPFFGLHPNSFSMPVVDEEVWVLNFSDNIQQLYWFKKDDYKANIESLFEDGIQEVICHRPIGDDKYASIYFSDGSGWVISSVGIINIDKDGQIHIKSQGESIINVANEQIDINSPGGTQVLVKDDNVKITTNEGGSISIEPDIIKLSKAEQPAVLGDDLKGILESLCGMLSKVASTGVTGTAGPYPVSGMIPGFAEANSIKAQLQKILSKNVKLS